MPLRPFVATVIFCFCGCLAAAAETAPPRPGVDWSQEPPLTQADVDIYLTRVLPLLLEARTAPQTVGGLEEFTAKLDGVGLSKTRLAMLLVKMNVGYAGLAGMENAMAAAEGMAESAALTPDERELLLRNADGLAAVYAEAAKKAPLPIPEELYGSDAGVIYGFLYYTTEYQGRLDPDIHLRMLVDIAPPERRALWREEILPALTLFLQHRLPDCLAAIDAILARHTEEDLGEAITALLMRQKGLAFMLMGNVDAAIDRFRAVADAYEAASDPVLRRLAALCRFAEGLTYFQHDMADPALAAYTRFVAAHGDDDNPYIRVQLAGAMHKVALISVQKGDLDAAMAMAEKLVAEHRGDDNFALMEYVTGAMSIEAVVLLQRGDRPGALALLAEVESMLADRREPNLVMQAIAAMVGRSNLLVEAGDIDDAVAVMDRIDQRYGGEKAAEATVAQITLSKARLLQRYGRKEEAEKAFLSVFDRFKDSPDFQSRTLSGMAADGLEGMR